MGVKSKAEVIGKTDFDIFPEDIAKGFWDNDKYVLETGQSIIDKVEILKNKNNKTKYLQTSKIPVKNEKGKVIGLVGIGHDVTERTMLMEQLLVAKEKAEESDRLKTSFLANMSHEIRTPLNSILGFTDLMTTDDTNDEEKEQYSEIIKKSADSLLHIINDIIDISSLETGQMKIIPEKFSINSLLKMLNREYKAKVIEAGKPDIEIITHMANPDVELYLDKNRVNQILINLIGNALKFTEKGFIEFGVVDVDQKYIYFKVKDTGTGIPEQMYDVIFERFRQLNDNSTRNVGGNGLGLSIVKNLVNIMGGEIRVESEQGKGSSFYFYLSQTLESKK
jgi:signal transduction histidine kinase